MGITTSRVTKMASSPEIQQFIKEAISKDKVVVFSKSYCPYCKLAKEVFQKAKQPIAVIELNEREDGDVIQDNLAQITGFRTVPQVFINGKCIGGGSDVKALYDSGKVKIPYLHDKLMNQYFLENKLTPNYIGLVKDNLNNS